MGWDGVKLGQVFGADLRAEGQAVPIGLEAVSI